MQRLVITLLLTLAALVVLFSLMQLAEPDQPTPPIRESEEVEDSAEDAAPVDGESGVRTDGAPAAPPPSPEEATEAASDAEAAEPIAGLRVRTVEEAQPDPTLGSTEPDEDANPYVFETQFTPFGAGVRHILLSRYSTNVREHEPYPLQQRLVLDYIRQNGEQVARYRYPMAAHSITVNGTRVYLLNQRWQVVADQTTDERAVFEITLVDEDDEPVLRITRTWEIQPGNYDIALSQRLENLSGQPLEVSFSQYGPADMMRAPGYIGDQRHVVIGYGQPRRARPEVKDPTTEDFYLSRGRVLDASDPVIWPPAEGDPERDLIWTAVTNRYFAAALFAPGREDEGRVVRRDLEPLFPTVRRDTWEVGEDTSMALVLESVPIALDAASAATLRTKLYAGPKKPAVLKEEPEHVAIGLGELIRYNLGGPCAALTFAWLAEGLLAFLTFIHSILLDWGVAIILLVAVVRLVLHPLTKRSQVNMLKMGKQMQALQPEIDRIKKKYADDQKKLQQEMMKLYQEKGVNPFAMGLGCLPMLVQMPIWVALYAMLYFAIELRHSPAFWGVFQAISDGAWPFLADLSNQDRFIPLPEFELLFLTINGINLLPLLMMVVFFLQQKYMAPPPSPNMTDEQRMQQKMMRYMVMLFPIILYAAPSGLNLYILASTSVGIVESMRVRRHIKELEDQGKLFQPKKKKEGGMWSRLQKAAEEQQKLMEQKQAQAAGTGKAKKGKKKGKRG